MCFVIPARSSHRFKGAVSIPRAKSSNTFPSFLRFPQYERASSLIGKVASVSVFSVRMRIHHPPSGALTICFHSNCIISLTRSPVKQEKIAALRSTGISHGVSARRFSSSRVRYSLLVSLYSIFSRKSLILSFINLSLYARFSTALNVEKYEAFVLICIGCPGLLTIVAVIR